MTAPYEDTFGDSWNDHLVASPEEHHAEEWRFDHHPDVVYGTALVGVWLEPYAGVAAPQARCWYKTGPELLRERRRARPVEVPANTLSMVLEACRATNSDTVTIAWEDGGVVRDGAGCWVELVRPATVYFDCDPRSDYSGTGITTFGCAAAVDLRKMSANFDPTKFMKPVMPTRAKHVLLSRA